MKMDCITFRSITPAQRAQRVLQRSGMEVVLQRTPRRMEERGCGYCLRLRHEDLQRAAVLLRQNGVGFQKLYSAEQGEIEEIVL